MRPLRAWMIRLGAALQRRGRDRDLEAEIECHLAFHADDNLRAGMTPADARRAALVKFGGVEAFKERYRDQQGVPFLEHFLQDLQMAIRRMQKAPGFTGAAIATLALGLGLNSAVLSLADALFLKPLGVDDAARVVLIDQTVVGRPLSSGFQLSYPDYAYYRDHARAFSDLAAHYSTSPMNVVTPGGAANVTGSVVTASYFRLLRLRPALGRFFSTEEDAVPDRDPVAVLSHDLWRTRFGGDPGILGTPVRINGTAFTVVGIAPKEFHGILSGQPPNDVWIPTAMFSVGYRYCDGLARGCAIVGLVGRLAENASIEGAQTEMDGLARQLASAFPETNRGRGVLVRKARGIRIQEQAKDAHIVALLAGAATLVLLVASANVAGLLLARGLRRRREIAIRLALGASRGRLVRLLLVESVVLAIAGGAVGLVVGMGSIELLRGFFGVSSVGALNLDLALDLRVAVVGFGVALLTGVLTGIAPALQSTRPETMAAMKDETAGAGARRSTLRDGLIVVQVAVSVVLLGSSGLLVRSFLMLHRGPGFDPNAIAVVRLRPSLIGYTNDRAWAFQREVIARLEAMPGIAAASPASVPPLPGWSRPRLPIQFTGDPTDPARAFQAPTTVVGPRYFKTLGVSVVEGREFDDRDTTDGPRVAIVNETLARRLWPDGGVVGSIVTIGGLSTTLGLSMGPTRCEIVGVVKDLQWVSALETPDPIAYLNFWQQDRGNRGSQDSRTHIRVSGHAAAMLPEIERAIAAIDPDVPISEGQSLGVQLDYQFAAVHAARTMLVTFGALALVLSLIGLYAALAFTVGQRTREIAVRMALGASRSDVGRLVLRRGVAMVGLGLASGLGAAVALAEPLLASLLYGVSPRDPYALMVGPSMLAAIALLAIWLPARHAMRQDPIVALRSE